MAKNWYFQKKPKKCQKYDARESILRRFYFLDIKVYKKEIILDNLLLTHAPTEEVGENQINVFGHIHDKPLDEKFDKKNHICVSCDVVDYTPVSIELVNKNFVEN